LGEGAGIKVNGGLRRRARAGKLCRAAAKMVRRRQAGTGPPDAARLVVAHPAVEARATTWPSCGADCLLPGVSDLPTGVGFHYVAIPREARFTARFDKTMLGGVTVLEGQARVRPEPPWTGLLYQPLMAAKSGTATYASSLLRLGNRGVSYMSVWLPRAD